MSQSYIWTEIKNNLELIFAAMDDRLGGRCAWSVLPLALLVVAIIDPRDNFSQIPLRCSQQRSVGEEKDTLTDPWRLLVKCTTPSSSSRVRMIDPTRLIARRKQSKTLFKTEASSHSHEVQPPGHLFSGETAIRTVSTLRISKRLLGPMGAPRAVSSGSNSSIYIADTIGCRIVK
eukprot:392809-Amorphochlora_amoeboformis.AAC.3